ncbi:unnamed protein product [Fusarium graminearum]|uniref:Chromosome 4, complete genome n=1 Tax=Gibberella zeae (strain ATCC MYA-4620 / CBS 123657 / FGSC 9075 / NRRL 31084 / PH-1) TaxID=229533 RepID=I1S883_GIBZE|nr:hypothetical protein FGSG_13061 [Fusarium graminearum PH-1]ESU13313.1 hypothetical protein FGSG_13061 [Fusarium graminearum PH-1]CEF83795.1 unnamed protein product [Fusarium graminearum]CZS72912.1 unnamed protein product [Fusarium graminearum]|eukprot:XP_011326820.1 hypothetical protein FGSG_13061 [Fusarium graminearum PH-1]
MQTRGVTLSTESRSFNLGAASRATANRKAGRDRDSDHSLNSHATPWTIPTPLPDSQLPIPHVYGLYRIDAVCVDGLMNNAILHISPIDATIYLTPTYPSSDSPMLKPSGYGRSTTFTSFVEEKAVVCKELWNEKERDWIQGCLHYSS